MPSPQFLKRKAFLDSLHAELLPLVGRQVCLVLTDKGKAFAAGNGKLSVSYLPPHGIKKYRIADGTALYSFSALELRSIVEVRNFVIITVEKEGYTK